MAPAQRTSDPAALDDRSLGELAERFEHAPARSIIRWAVDTFGDGLVLTTSLTDALLVDLAQRVDPTIPVVFVDTGFHFAETLDTLETVRRRYDPRLMVVSADEPLVERWRTDTDACCAVRKVEPLERALAGRSAWLSGLRRQDSPSRAATPVVERDRRGLVKINPIAAWTDLDVDAYLRDHDVPRNPLVAQGYPSVGCWPCTRAPAPGEDRRAGRWAGTPKTECGLHL